MPEIAIGRKEIMKALHVLDWGTVRSWRAFGLPLRRLPNGKPMIVKTEAITWMIQYDELKKKQRIHT